MHLNTCALFVLIGTWACGVANAATFWQITDVHFDEKYSQFGDVANMCHGNDSKWSIGRYGHGFCDAPTILVTSAVEAMKKIEANPDFILWTGDTSPHVKDLQWDQVFENVRRVTELLRDNFPNTTLVPVLGNHDTTPANGYPNEFKGRYEDYLKKGGWDSMIKDTKSFLRGGYYAMDLENSRIRILTLNTNLYLMENPLRTDLALDIGRQYSWLKNELKLARQGGYLVFITGHVPPGFYELLPIESWMEHTYNDPFVDLLVNNSDVIMTQIYGHQHSDTFRLFYTNDPMRVAKTHAYLAPAVTPFTDGANPAIRLYTYDPVAPMLLDYDQYFLNLSRANAEGDAKAQQAIEQATVVSEEPLQNQMMFNSSDSTTMMVNANETGSNPQWEHLYRATELFRISNLSTAGAAAAYLSISIKQDVFDLYFKYNLAGTVIGECDAYCKKKYLCAVARQRIEEMSVCLKSATDKVSDEAASAVTFPPWHSDAETLPNTATTFSEEAATTTPAEIIDKHRRTIKIGHLPMQYVIIGIALVVLGILLAVTVYVIRRNRLRPGFRYVKHISTNSDP